MTNMLAELFTKSVQASVFRRMQNTTKFSQHVNDRWWTQ